MADYSVAVRSASTKRFVSIPLQTAFYKVAIVVEAAVRGRGC